MRCGKHVYCEKPGANSVFDARMLAKVAAEQQVATQLGTQMHASDNYRRIVELIRAGAIGAVEECHIWLRAGGSTSGRLLFTLLLDDLGVVTYVGVDDAKDAVVERTVPVLDLEVPSRFQC